MLSRLLKHLICEKNSKYFKICIIVTKKKAKLYLQNRKRHPYIKNREQNEGKKKMVHVPSLAFNDSVKSQSILSDSTFYFGLLGKRP